MTAIVRPDTVQAPVVTRPASRPAAVGRDVLDRYAHDPLPAPGGRWQRAWTHHTLSQYRRLVFMTIVVNAALLVYGLTGGGWWSADRIALGTLTHLVTVNLTVAVIIRQQHVINLLFRVATAASTDWPLAIRRVLGKVYHFGGLHSGAAGAATVWFALLTVSTIVAGARGQAGVTTGLLAVACLLLVLLVGIFVIALPGIRGRYHDLFERTHRFGGWLALALFWAYTVVGVQSIDSSGGLGRALAASPTFWLLCLVTGSILLPWLRLRRVPVAVDTPSNHVALARFDYGVTPFAGSSTAISRNPLLEWHSFANVPAPDEDGFRLTISRAGDWTGAFIDDRPRHVWVKGIPTAGVGNIDKLFKRVVWVATGSGIGPCLPHLLAETAPAHLVWSTRAPRATYGDALVDEIMAVQPNATIWDTSADGKPDMVKLAYAAVQAFDAEAVICISNQKLTRQVVHGLESRGIPAYGAIWDS